MKHYLLFTVFQGFLTIFHELVICICFILFGCFATFLFSPAVTQMGTVSVKGRNAAVAN